MRIEQNETAGEGRPLSSSEPKVSSVVSLFVSRMAGERQGSWLLNESFNDKPQASSPIFAYACGSPLNEAIDV